MSPDATPAPPWDRQPTDTDASWAAFEVYRNLGHERSIAKTAAAMNRPGSRSLMEGWSTRHGWVRRATAFDQQQRMEADAAARGATQEARSKVLDRQRIASEALLSRGLAALQKVRPEDIAAKDLPKWIEVAVRLSRQAVGLPDRIGGDQDMLDDVEVGPVGHLSPEENRARLVLLQREAARRTETAGAA